VAHVLWTNQELFLMGTELKKLPTLVVRDESVLLPVDNQSWNVDALYTSLIAEDVAHQKGCKTTYVLTHSIHEAQKRRY